MTQTRHMTDAQLKNAVAAELHWTASVDSTHVGISVNDGTVTLSGEVDSYPEKFQASAAAQRVDGVTAIATEITVRGIWATTSDADLARAAGQAIDRAVDVPDSVKVSVHDRYLTLSGDVKWNYQREAAARQVQYLEGVTGVANDVVVRPDLSTSVSKADIGAALQRHAAIEAQRIHVTADDAGVVTLTGTVSTFAERHQAEQVAWSAPGVTGVTSHLGLGQVEA